MPGEGHYLDSLCVAVSRAYPQVSGRVWEDWAEDFAPRAAAALPADLPHHVVLLRRICQLRARVTLHLHWTGPAPSPQRLERLARRLPQDVLAVAALAGLRAAGCPGVLDDDFARLPLAVHVIRCRAGPGQERTIVVQLEAGS